MEKVKFIQLDKDAKPIVHDGFGYCFKFINALPGFRRDGRDIVVMYTGYKIILPDGYIGQIYDTPVANILSCTRMQTTQFITNDFPYEKDPKRGNLGLYLSYNVTGGISSVIFDPNVAFIGLSVFKINNLKDMEITQEIFTPPTKEETKNENNG